MLDRTDPAPVDQSAESMASKSIQCGFESHRGHVSVAAWVLVTALSARVAKITSSGPSQRPEPGQEPTTDLNSR